MQSTTIIRGALLVLVIAMIAYGATTIYFSQIASVVPSDAPSRPMVFPTSQTIQNSIDSKLIESIQASLNAKKTDVALPVHIVIPSISVDAAIVNVGVTPQGNMDVPKSPADVAWYSLGPRPGEIGSAVLSGHYGWKDGVPAVFDKLYKLKKGDKVYIKDEKGATTTFVVRESRTYGENEDASNVFGFGSGAQLNLITCRGVWNKDIKSYSERLVVFTDKDGP